MVKYTNKYLAIPVVVSWFSAKKSLIDYVLPNVYYHIKELNGNVVPGKKETTKTLEIDLDQPEEKIHAAFIKSLRQQVRQAEDEGIQCYIKNDDIAFFVDFFNQFARSKKIHTVTVSRLNEMTEFLNLSFASYQGVVLAAHSYIVDNDLKIVRAFHSASRRLEDSVERSRVAKANKLLHYKDMIAFKRMGFKIYDFGGIAINTDNPELKGINDFKMSFGGNVVDCVNYYNRSYLLIRRISRLFGVTNDTAE